MPANLYGIGDNFNLKSSHVLPALVKKFTIAKNKKLPTVEVWGSGNVKREFLNVNDLASAVKFVINKKMKKSFVNVGSKDYLKIRDLVKIIKSITGYKGKVIYNKKYPDGVKKRKLDTRVLDDLGWKAKIKIDTGLNKII